MKYIVDQKQSDIIMESKHELHMLCSVYCICMMSKILLKFLFTMSLKFIGKSNWHELKVDQSDLNTLVPKQRNKWSLLSVIFFCLSGNLVMF